MELIFYFSKKKNQVLKFTLNMSRRNALLSLKNNRYFLFQSSYGLTEDQVAGIYRIIFTVAIYLLIIISLVYKYK